MQFLAKFSHTSESRKISFWEDAWDTENWLKSLGKSIERRDLVLRARGLSLLRPWTAWQTQPLTVEGWLYPMDIRLTWDYLLEFLTALGPDSIWIPCGGDSLITWHPRGMTIRAPRDSWIWALVEEVWDPASWHPLDEIEWWVEGCPQNARRFSWGFVESRVVANGWEEWRLVAEEDQSPVVATLWRQLVERLGSRPVRVRWRQERLGPEESLLGLPVRYTMVEMLIPGTDPATFIRDLSNTHDLYGLRVWMQWLIPQWNRHWGTRVTLRKWKQSSRLEAHYWPKTMDTSGAVRQMRREIRRLPILDMRPVLFEVDSLDSWDALKRRGNEWHRLERLAAELTNVRWPHKFSDYPDRIRVPEPWQWSFLESQRGTWVLSHPSGLRIAITWPVRGHPGTLNIRLAHVLGLHLKDMDPWMTINRFNQDWRYWATLLTDYLIPRVEKWLAAQVDT